MEAWQIWVIAAIVLFAVEVLTPDLIMGSLGIGCLGAGLSAYFGVSLTWQIGVFCLAAMIVMVTARPWAKRFLYRSSACCPTGGDALVGRVGTVIEEIRGEGRAGRVRLDAEEWRALSSEPESIPSGAQVEVTRVESATLVVKNVS